MNAIRLCTAVTLLVLVSAHTSAANAEKKAAAGVSGKVVLDGQPLSKGTIAFHPAKGKPVAAKVKDGQFSVRSIPAGTYRVSIKGTGVAKKYGNAKSSGLTVEIKSGGNSVVFELKS